MLIKTPPPISTSEITDRKLYLIRREFLRAASSVPGAAAVGVIGETFLRAAQPAQHIRKLTDVLVGLGGRVESGRRSLWWPSTVHVCRASVQV